LQQLRRQITIGELPKTHKILSAWNKVFLI
jgi:hypothetical protein